MEALTMGQLRINRKSWRQRFLQVSLRTLVAVTALACVAAAICGWRERHERRLAELVTQFNASMDEGEYQTAVQIAERAMTRFPDQPVARLMLEKGRCALAISRREPLPDMGFACQ
jgi:hypothetical protein